MDHCRRVLLPLVPKILRVDCRLLSRHGVHVHSVQLHMESLPLEYVANLHREIANLLEKQARDDKEVSTFQTQVE